MATNNPFTPGATKSLNVTNSTASVGLTNGALDQQVMVTSAVNNALAFIKFGGTGVTAAVTDTPILPGAIMVFTIGISVTTVAAIGTSGTTLYFTVGLGT